LFIVSKSCRFGIFLCLHNP